MPPDPLTRFGAAWKVLKGERLVQRQIQAEWFEYQQIFNDLLQRLSAQLARQARSEKKRVRALVQSSQASDPSPPPQRELPLPTHSRKSELRRRYSGLFVPSQSPQLPNGSMPSPPEESP